MQSPKKDMAGVISFYPSERPDLIEQLDNLKFNENDPLNKVKDGENALAFYSQYYQPIPLVLRGYGAGTEVTAAGVFADVLRTLNWKQEF